MVNAQEQGVFHLDSNAEEGHRFDEIVIAMQTAFRRRSWLVKVHDQYQHDQRLVGGSKNLPPLSTRLPL
jgi:dTDP-4-dehydrorhamnose reductase